MNPCELGEQFAETSQETSYGQQNTGVWDWSHALLSRRFSLIQNLRTHVSILSVSDQPTNWSNLETSAFPGKEQLCWRGFLKGSQLAWALLTNKLRCVAEHGTELAHLLETANANDIPVSLLLSQPSDDLSDSWHSVSRLGSAGNRPSHAGHYREPRKIGMELEHAMRGKWKTPVDRIPVTWAFHPIRPLGRSVG